MVGAHSPLHITTSRSPSFCVGPTPSRSARRSRTSRAGYRRLVRRCSSRRRCLKPTRLSDKRCRTPILFQRESANVPILPSLPVCLLLWTYSSIALCRMCARASNVQSHRRQWSVAEGQSDSIALLCPLCHNSLSSIPATCIRCLNKPILSGLFLCMGTEIRVGFPTLA